AGIPFAAGMTCSWIALMLLQPGRGNPARCLLERTSHSLPSAAGFRSLPPAFGRRARRPHITSDRSRELHSILSRDLPGLEQGLLVVPASTFRVSVAI